MKVTLERWDAADFGVLERANTDEMTRHLGGPETAEQLIERHQRYLRLNESGEAHMLRIDADGVAVGGIGYWKVDHDGVSAWETGWSVEPAWLPTQSSLLSCTC